MIYQVILSWYTTLFLNTDTDIFVCLKSWYIIILNNHIMMYFYYDI